MHFHFVKLRIKFSLYPRSRERRSPAVRSLFRNSIPPFMPGADRLCLKSYWASYLDNIFGRHSSGHHLHSESLSASAEKSWLCCLARQLTRIWDKAIFSGSTSSRWSAPLGSARWTFCLPIGKWDQENKTDIHKSTISFSWLYLTRTQQQTDFFLFWQMKSHQAWDGEATAALL